MSLLFLINSVVCMGLGFAAASFLFRRYASSVDAQVQALEARQLAHEKELAEWEQRLQRAEQELEGAQREVQEKTEALRTIIYRAHHRYVNPVTRRIRGLCELGLGAVKRIFNFLEQLQKPLHHSYSTLAMMENTEAMDCLRMINSEALALEKENMNIVKEFEHLQ